jgi:hypothetical protein
MTSAMRNAQADFLILRTDNWQINHRTDSALAGLSHCGRAQADKRTVYHASEGAYRVGRPSSERTTSFDRNLTAGAFVYRSIWSYDWALLSFPCDSQGCSLPYPPKSLRTFGHARNGRSRADVVCLARILRKRPSACDLRPLYRRGHRGSKTDAIHLTRSCIPKE